MLKNQFLALSIFLGSALLCPARLALGQKTTITTNTTVIPVPAPYYRNWRMVAQADLIVQGKLYVPVQKIRELVKVKRPSYVALQLDVHRALKGRPASKTLRFQFYPDNSPYNPSVATVLASNGKEVVVSLVQVEEMSSQLYFAGDTPEALLAARADVVKSIGDEWSNQKLIAAYYARPVGFEATPLDSKVKKLIDGMTSESSEFESFASLEALGKAAVPATIRWLDDRRQLPIPQIELENKSPQAFEATRHYGPRVVVDALAAILNQVTGESFGFIYNGGTERERRLAVNGWRTFLYYHPPHAN